MTYVIVTNHTSGNHDPETWAQATASMIADASGLSGERLASAQALQAKLAEVLQRYHAIVQDEERKALLADPSHVETPLEVTLDMATVMDALVAATEGTPWEEQFRDPVNREQINKLVGNHFMSSMNVERLVHNDKLNMYRGAI